MLTKCFICGGKLVYRGKEGQLVMYHCPTCVVNLKLHEDEDVEDVPTKD